MRIADVVHTYDVASERTVIVAGAELSRELASALAEVVVLIKQGVIDADTLDGTRSLPGP